MRTERIDVVGGFTVDAIIRADGSWVTGQFGGNALWASMGVRLLGAPVAAHSVVGADYPVGALSAISAHGVDLTGVRRDTETPNARITYAYGADGSREQPAPAGAVAVLPERVRGEFADTTRDPAITMASLPDGRALAGLPGLPGSAWHLGLLPPARFAELVAVLRGAGAAYIQADCPARSELRRDGDGALRRRLADVDVFLPSTSDTDVFAPGVDRRELVARFHDYGAPVVVMKCAAEGAWVSDARSGARWAVPAFDGDGVDIDATGAGDVFCGAFAAAFVGGADLLDAAVVASACASYALRVASPLDLTPPAGDDLAGRIHRIRNGVESL